MKFIIKSPKTADTNRQIDLIYKKIDRELSKSPEQIDMDAVNELFKQIENLDGGVYRKNNEELKIELSKIRNKQSRKSHSIPIFIKKSVIGISAACILLFSAFSFTALAVGGYSEAWYYISSSVSKFLHLESGFYEENGITIIKGKYNKKYSDIEELIENEQLPILYPSQLPQDIKIQEIIQIDYENNLHELIFSFSTDNLRLTITNYDVTDLSKIAYETIKINNIDYFIYSNDTGTYHATFYYNGFQHNMTHVNYEDLISILSFMKGSL